MLRVTRWSPDTCGCVLDLEWDDAQDENTRTHKVKTVVKRCPAHALDDATVFASVLSENRRKNGIFGLVQSILPSATPDDYIWSFDKDRVLRASFPRLTMMQRNQLQTLCDSRFGSGKVKVA